MTKQRLHLSIRGAVQGVGFRPFVYRLATELNLTGWVSNTAQGVFLEIEGVPQNLETFQRRLLIDKPPLADIRSCESRPVDPQEDHTFEIRGSRADGQVTAVILPDLATCRDCLRDIFDPGDRRYLYPFTNCTNCGPRFSIIERLPYDRAHTTMKSFTMCPHCHAEYLRPLDRRFHAQPNACPRCGPQLELWTPHGEVLGAGPEALLQAAEAIRAGHIVAVKGLGGFHLIVDARREAAVRRLRDRKAREAKPLAVMFPSLTEVLQGCAVTPGEQVLLCSPASPIVLLRRRDGGGVADAVAPGNPYLGVMLPYTPLHHILLRALGFPVVATSGNLCDEPMCIDEHEAVDRLGGIADLLLVHNRPILRHVDDSVTCEVLGREMILRRARGYAPLPIRRSLETVPTLAVGGQLKNAIAVSNGGDILISQHIGDLETPEAYAAFVRTTVSLGDLYHLRPAQVACDLHPDYRSSRYARECGMPVFAVQHHHAHVTACMADNDLSGDVLGVSWDGTGYGPDGTIWGGEFLLADCRGFQRFAHLRTFALPGGDQAVRQPRRTALGLLYEIYGAGLGPCPNPAVQSFAPSELAVVLQALDRQINAPRTSSMGRLFDGVAALAGIRQHSRFEGQAAMDLEFAAEAGLNSDPYPYTIDDRGPVAVVDWEPLIEAILSDVQREQPPASIAARFHHCLAEMVVDIARRSGRRQVVLSGGCFQNRFLLQRCVSQLQDGGFSPYWHHQIPPNDGGLCVGQIVAAQARNQESPSCA